MKNLAEKIKNSKPFSKWDAIVFIAAAFVVAVLFIAIIPARADESPGFKVLLGQTEIYSYRYGGQHIINERYADRIQISDENDGTFTVKIFTDTDKTEFNLLAVNDGERWVKVKDSNCSARRDCVYFPPLDSEAGSIICVPHDLKILPLGNAYVPPVTG